MASINETEERSRETEAELNATARHDRQDRNEDISTAKRLGSKWWGLAVIAIAQLMVAMDTAIMAVALPSAQSSLGMSDTDRQWVFSAYTLTFGGLLLLGGRLSDRLGRRRTLLIAVFGFVIASVLGGAAASGWMLIGARALQGAFGALLVPSATSFVAILFPVKQQLERAKAMGFFNATLISGVAMGFILGGLLTDSLGWRWCLYVNVPLSIIAGLGALVILPDLEGHPDVGLDIPGAALACAGMVALVYGLGQAASSGWQSSLVICSLAVSAVLLTTFVLVEARVRSPLLPLRIVAERNRAGSFIARGLSSFGLFGMLLVLTFHLQVVMQASPLAAGLALIPFAAASALTSALVAPQLMSIIPPRYLIVPGIGMCAAGMFLLAFLKPDVSSLPLILAVQVLQGLGSGLINTPALNTALSGVAKADTGVTSAMASTSNTIGASIGTALLNTIAAGVAASYLASHALVTPNGQNARDNIAIVHGYMVAATWGGAILLVGALIVAICINTRPRE